MQTEVWKKHIFAESHEYANFSRCFASEQLIYYGCIFICQTDNRGQIIVELRSKHNASANEPPHFLRTPVLRGLHVVMEEKAVLVLPL